MRIGNVQYPAYIEFTVTPWILVRNAATLLGN